MVRRLTSFLSVLGVLFLLSRPALGRDSAQFTKYLDDTIHALNCMRRATGLLADTAAFDAHPPPQKASCPLLPIVEPTTPTNIALDLLVQRELYESTNADAKALATKNIAQVIDTLKGLVFHADSGMFYNEYDPSTGVVDDIYVSSVDNMHLGYALWVYAYHYPVKDVADKAKALFKRMNFAVFYDPKDGLIRGGLKNTNTGWIPEPWKYGYFGSESRSLYTLGYVLELISDTSFLDKAFQSFEKEVMLWNDHGTSRRLLGLWDGGAFQLMLPSLLVNERVGSSELGAMMNNYSSLVLSEQQRLTLAVPATFSACRVADGYNGEAGSPIVVSSFNNDFGVPALRANWDEVFTPHAAFLASVGNPSGFSDLFATMENINSAQGNLYVHGMGWMDGFYVKGTLAGQVVPDILSLDDGMLALAIFQILSADKMLTGERAMMEDSKTHSRLMEYLNRVDTMLKNSKTTARSLF